MRTLALILLLTIVSIISVSCKNNGDAIDEGKVENSIYHSDEIGWTMNVPEGWKMRSKAKLEASIKKGREIINEEYGEIDYSGVKKLLSFEKNALNNFNSTSTPYDAEIDGDWFENQVGVKLLMYHAVASQGISVDTSSTRTERIDNVDFRVFTLTLKDPKTSESPAQVTTYSTLLNGFSFSAILSYDNERDHNEILKVWKASVFEDK